MKGDLLTGRERARLALSHRATDRVPIALVCAGLNEPARGAFAALLARERGVALDDYLEARIDIAGVSPRYVGPPLAPGCDHWGVRRRTVSFGLGAYSEIDHHPLAGAGNPGDLDRHAWPDPGGFDYSVLPDRIAAVQARRERAILVANGNIFETSWYMRGFEQMFVDLATDPEMADAILERVTRFYIEYFRRILAAARGAVDLVFTADDIGGQNGLLLSLDLWKRFIQPRHARLNAAIHEYGARVIYHSDGAIMEAVPGLVEMGIDVLQALQFDAAGMDPVALKERHGARLCFEGGVSVQRTLPFGTPDDVRAEVRRLISVLGRDGGYILGPAHAIQAGTPPENILAMFDEAETFHPQG